MVFEASSITVPVRCANEDNIGNSELPGCSTRTTGEDPPDYRVVRPGSRTTVRIGMTIVIGIAR